MDTMTKFIPLLIFAVLFFTACGNANKPEESASTPKANTQQSQSNKNLDLGMTFEQFQTVYESEISNGELMISLDNAHSDTKIFFAEKMKSCELPLYSLKNATVTSTENGYLCKFKCADVDMRISKDPTTENISKIEIITKPFYHTTNAEKTFLLLIQSTVFSLTVGIFAPEMKQQEYREMMIKRFYSNPDVNYLLNDKVRCRLIRKDDLWVLQARAKDLDD